MIDRYMVLVKLTSMAQCRVLRQLGFMELMYTEMRAWAPTAPYEPVHDVSRFYGRPGDT